MQSMVTLLMLVFAASMQRIETQYPDRARVTRIETMVNHLTVIELAEPVTLAAAGSPSFKIERRENRVFIQPLEEEASTNLFVWTNSGRWNYELVPAKSVETMHFAIDQQVVGPAQTGNSPIPPLDSAPSPWSAEEMLLFSKPIRNLGAKFSSTQVGVFITDVYRKDEQLFVRYVIDNRTPRPHASGIPEVFSLDSPHSDKSLQTMRYSQRGPDIQKKIRSRGQTRVPMADCEVPSDPVPSGEMGSGILILQLPETLPDSDPRVLQFVFPIAGNRNTSLMLIL
jgi:hypothetical protein